jgi:hypothetical protein
MKTPLLLFLLLVLLPLPGYAMWGFLPLDVAVQTSDLIVIGTLHGVREDSKNGIDYGRGLITVDEVIWGDAVPGQELTLTWKNKSNIVCPRIEHKPNENNQVIWLLNLGKEEVRADHPQRVVQLKERAEVEKYLQAKKVSLRSYDYLTEQNSPTNITIMYRNPTESDIQFPGIEVRGDSLYISPDIDIKLFQRSIELDNDTETRQSSDKIIVSDDVSPVTVKSKQVYRLSIDLKQFFEIREGEHYYLNFTAKGNAPANELLIYLLYEKPSKGRKASSSEEEAAISYVLLIKTAILVPIMGMIISFTVFNNRRRRDKSSRI